MPSPATNAATVKPPPEAVEAKLRRAWRKGCRFVHARGLGTLVLWLAALIGLDFLVDWLFLLPGYARVALALLNLVVLGWVAYDKWLRHGRRYNAVRVALQVERRHPELKSLLISYVQISQQPRPGESVSPGLIQALRREAIQNTAPLDFREIVNFRELRRLLGFSAAVLLLCAAASIHWTDYANAFLNRMTRPSSALSYPTRTRIVRITGSQVVRQGAPVTIEAMGANKIPSQGRLMVKPAQGPWEQLPFPKVGPDRFEYQFAELFQDFSYQVRLGDAVSETYRLEVVPPPRLLQSRVRVEYPAYTGLAAQELDSLNLEVPEGSTLTWKLQCDQPLAAAALTFEGGAPVPLQLDGTGRECRLILLATNSFVYRFQWTERAHGYVYDGGVNYFVNTIPDAAPEVEWVQPTENDNATVRKKLTLAFRANDDYRVANAWIVHSLNQSPEQKHPLGAFTNAAVEAGAVWDLKEAMPALKEKDVVSFALEVADNRAGKSGPNLTRTRPLQLAIVSPEEYLSYVLEKQAKLVKEIESMQKEEQSASREVKSLQEVPADPAPAPLAAASPPNPADLADRLFSEAERQHLVDQRLDVVVEGFRSIVADLVSNELLSQAKGAELQHAAQVLQVLGSKHVPSAARYLEEARQRWVSLRPNLQAADGEIAIIVRELDQLLKRVGPQQTLDDLLSELRIILKQEKAAHASTKQWGAQLYQSPAAAERDRRPLAENQAQIADRTSRFEERLRESYTNETDTVRKVALEKATQLVQQKPVAPLLSGAATDITQKRPVPAVTKQAEALRALEALDKLLQPDSLLADLEALKEMRAKLEALLKDQEQLRQRTESIAPAEFDAAKNALQAGERDLQNRLTQIQTNAPPAVSDPVRSHMNDAGQNMKQAETQIAQTQQPPAVTSQRNAEEDLKKAIAALDQDIAALEQQMQNFPDLADLAAKALELAEDQKALREQTSQTQSNAIPQRVPQQNQLGQRAQALQSQLPLPQFQTAVSEMQSASQQLQQAQQQPAMQNQANAEQALREAAQALNAAAAALQLAEQQAQLMQQTGATPMAGLPQLTPPQNALGQQAGQMQFLQAAGFMQQAGQSLLQQQGQQAMGQQQSAINSLIGAAEGALGMQPGTMPGMMGLMPGMMPGMGLMPGMQAMNVPGFNPREIGSRYFGRQNAAGPNNSSGDARWGAISPREREALHQKFARELPLEYRDLIEAYYEALAK